MADDARRFRRICLPPMYTFVRLRPPGRRRYPWSGHIYNISESGMHFEVDQPIDPGTEVEISAMLPGPVHRVLHATGRVVRLHDDADDPAPIRMALAFSRFQRPADHQQLKRYLDEAFQLAA